MEINPSNFYISIIDLFAILLPGAIATLVLYHLNQVEIDAFLNKTQTNQGFHFGIILLFSSYLLGHIISQVSAYLDELVYNKLQALIFNERNVNTVKEIRKEIYGNKEDPHFLNAYKWTMFKLQKEQPHAVAEIDRYMADSKFFRSLFIILIILVIVFAVPPNQNLNFVLICLALSAFSMIRYFTKRRKATETAFLYIIFTEHLNTKRSD